MSRYPVQGKIALVTGAARGIGLSTARALHDRGAYVVLADVDAEATERAAAGISAGRTLGIGVDVTDREAVQRAVGAAAERFGGLDIVVANAGITEQLTTVRAIDEELFERVIDVNLLGVWRTVRAALPQVIDRRGHVVVTSSIYAFANGMAHAPYAASKAGVEQFGRALRTELAGHGASASVAYWGYVETAMLKYGLDDDPAVQRLESLMMPRIVRKRITADQAAHALVRGIERRAPRIILPRRWAAVSALRGLVNPVVDCRFEHTAGLHSALLALEQRGDAPDQRP